MKTTIFIAYNTVKAVHVILSTLCGWLTALSAGPVLVIPTLSTGGSVLQALCTQSPVGGGQDATVDT